MLVAQTGALSFFASQHKQRRGSMLITVICLLCEYHYTLFFFCQAHLCGAFIQKYPSIHYNIPFTLFYILTVRQSISYLTTEAEQDPILDIKIILIINCIIICAYGTNSIQYEICLAGMLHVLCCHHCIRPSVTAEHFEPTLDGALWKSLLLLLL